MEGAPCGVVRSGPSLGLLRSTSTRTRLVSKLRFTSSWSFNNLAHTRDAHLGRQVVHHALGQSRRGSHDFLLSLDGHLVGHLEAKAASTGEQHRLTKVGQIGSAVVGFESEHFWY